jgi:hypothetical protein
MRKLFWGPTVTLLLLASLPVALTVWNLHTYSRLTDEALIARLRFVSIEPRHYRVELRTGDFCEEREFELFGDEWRLDARFLKWKPLANLFGLDAMYRLERLSGRYRSVADENTQKHRAYDISQPAGLDLLSYLERDWKYWSPVDTYFGSSVYESIDPAYEYSVFRSQSGLLVRRELLRSAHYEGGALVIHIRKDCPE